MEDNQNTQNNSKKQKKIIIILIVILAIMVIVLSTILIIKKGKLFGKNSENSTEITEDPALNDGSTGVDPSKNNDGTSKTSEEETTTEEPEITWDAVISRDGLMTGNDDYVIYEMDIVGGQTTGDNGNEINISKHFNYDFANRTITSTEYRMLDNIYNEVDVNNFRYDIPAELNIFNVEAAIDSDFLVDFDTINADDTNRDTLKFEDGHMVEKTHISESEFAPGEWKSYMTYDDKGRIIEDKYEGEGDSANTTTWTYDDAGNITEVTDNVSTRTYEYNDLGYPTSCHTEESWADDVTYKDYEYIYDDNNRIININCKLRQEHYISATETENVGNEEIKTEIEYDENGNATEISYSRELGPIQAHVHYSYRYAKVEDLKNGVEIPKEDKLTRSQIFEAIVNYCCEENPDLLDIINDGQYMVGWGYDGSIEGDETSIGFRSYTGAYTSFYVNVNTGEVTMSQNVPGITDGDQPLDETFNVHDYTERD